MLAFLAAVILAEVSPSPSPPVTVGADISFYGLRTSGQGGANADVSNALVNISLTGKRWQAALTAGDYGFPTAGFPLLTDTQAGANVALYGALPLASVTYAFDSHLSVSAGKFAALLGQESPFTYQNLNVQRGIGWAMEPTIGRGAQVAYVNGAWNATLQDNDAYYSGGNRALEGLAGWSPSPNTALQFAFIVPGANVPRNITTAIGDKAEYDLMYTRRIGRLQVLPYVLYVHSPASAALGYPRDEDALAAVLLGAWTFSPKFSIAFRYEAAANGSSQTDTGANSDLVGYGAGSRVQSVTLTPAFRFGNGGVLRLEYSYVHLTAFKLGAGFGPTGEDAAQSRLGFEIGVMH